MPLKPLKESGENFPKDEPDVQRTSFSVDVLGRYICNTFGEATTNPNFDVVVIGSGMYGAYCAAKIYGDSEAAGRPLRVLVLEAGPFLVAEHGQNIPNLGLSNPFRGKLIFPGSPDALKTRDLVWGMGWRGNTGFPGTAYCIGGKSLYWGGWCPRLQEVDLNQWPAAVKEYLTNPPLFESTYLLNRKLAPAAASVYEAVEFDIGVKPADDFVFDPILGPEEPPDSVGLNEAFRALLGDALAKLRTGAGTPLGDPEPPPIAVQTQSFVSGVFSPDKFSSLTLLTFARRQESGRRDQNGNPIPDSEVRLFIVPNAHVSKLIVPNVSKDGTQSAGHSITGVEVWVDGVRQPQPLKINPTCTVVLALGCFESTRLALESFPTAPDRPSKDELMGRNLMAHLRFDFEFTIDRQRFRQWIQQIKGKPLRDQLQMASFHLQGDTADGRFHFQVYAAGIANRGGEGLLYSMIPDSTLAGRLASNQDPNKIKVIFRACGEMKGTPNVPVYALNTSWVDLDKNDRDTQFDHARAYVNYADQSQARIWNHMREAAVALAQQMGADGIPDEDHHEVGSTWHDSGTLFMGDSPAESVTDVCGNFHHIANAACVDQALFPTVGSANPVLTGLCLSRRVAETIVSRHLSQRDLTAAEITQEKTEGFVFLLEGANAAKWKPNNPIFKTEKFPNPLIENGTILEVHGKSGLGVLFYDDLTLFGDFELRLQWKAFLEPETGEISANSGVFLRAPSPPSVLNDDNFYKRAIEIQIDDTGYDSSNRKFRSPLHRTGAVYQIAPARVRLQKVPSTDDSPGVWNEFRITARGRRVTVLLNGMLCSEGDVPQALGGSGLLGLQYHDGKVQFRAIRARMS